MDINIALLIIIALMFLYILFKDYSYAKERKEMLRERKDLLNRLMSKDLKEYASIGNKEELPRGKNPLKDRLVEKEEYFKEEGLYR